MHAILDQLDPANRMIALLAVVWVGTWGLWSMGLLLLRRHRNKRNA